MLEKLKSAKNKRVGTKQTSKAVDAGLAQIVFIAKDAEERITKPLIEKCKAQNVEIIYVETMKQLGEACGIEVGAASAALLKE